MTKPAAPERPQSIAVLGDALSGQIVAGADVLQRALTMRTAHEAVAIFAEWYSTLAKTHLAIIAAAKLEAETLAAPDHHERH